MTTYPAKQHLINTAKRLDVQDGVILVHGNEIIVHPDSDTEYDFHQDSNFFYVSGVAESGFAVAYDIKQNKAILFVQHVSDDEAVWIGVPPSLEDYRQKHGFDAAHFTHEIKQVLGDLNPSKVFTLPAPANRSANSDLGDLASRVDANPDHLLEALHESRVIKDEHEIAIMQRATEISAAAHLALMRETRPGMNEAEVRGRFVGLALSQGCSYEAYGSIAAGGRNAAVLHYTKNNMPLDNQQEMILVDAGGTFGNYASDITRTWPIGPKFSPECRAIYEVVLDMQKQVLAACVPNRQYEDMHRLANRVAAEGLLRLGILKGDLDSIVENYVTGYFMPHGIGHVIGIDTHDVGGYPKGVERVDAPGIRNLRTRRMMLPGMALTVEPGLYFVDAQMEEARLKPEIAQHIDFDMVAKYRKVGGVRIEDDIVITETGHLNMTNCPKEVAEIEAIRANACA